MVLGGLAVTLAPVVALKPVPGLQEYVVAPLALSVVGFPEQIEAELTFTVGVALTVTVEVLALVQPAVVPVTVYTVVPDGVTLILVDVAPVFQL